MGIKGSLICFTLASILTGCSDSYDTNTRNIIDHSVQSSDKVLTDDNCPGGGKKVYKDGKFVSCYITKATKEVGITSY